ncbi:hypothetical protein IVA79_31335 [Bradyrhizobium sp. 138]|uniref:LuxR C-terminal-related transcriptional regulator n=1 Tax=Bradyrhizobium sp. 138 TaxID=2782615 RepID=UPI001FFBDC35|nr:LuxR C-terminal-related transcriptional regulator [Bradyrhizobium sp. 138]MCK1738353.1 hypothetical protein [Bradyrhizobium sp. 138]
MIGGVVLSPRECQCLECSARGKSAREIGIILGIAEQPRDFTWTTPVRSWCQLASSSDRAVHRIKISKMKHRPSINTCGTAQDALA